MLNRRFRVEAFSPNGMALAAQEPFRLLAAAGQGRRTRAAADRFGPELQELMKGQPAAQSGLLPKLYKLLVWTMLEGHRTGWASCSWAKTGGGRREKPTKTRLVKAAMRHGGFIRKLRIVPYFGIFIRK